MTILPGCMARGAEGTIVGSKHDLSSFNERAGVQEMEDEKYNDYGEVCVYRHTPHFWGELCTPMEPRYTHHRFIPDVYQWGI